MGSDPLALLHVTDRFVYLDEDHTVSLTTDSLTVFDASGNSVEPAIQRYEHGSDAADKAGFRHYMLKEIHEQPRALAATLEGRMTAEGVLPEILGPAPWTS